MSEERFDRIEHRLDELATNLTQVRSDVSQAIHDSATQFRNECSTQIRESATQLRETLGREMRVLFEQTNDNIKALALPVPELERRWKADDAVVREDIGRRLDPLEAAVRGHLGT